MKSKDFTDAIKDYTYIINQDSENEKAFYNRGKCYESLKIFNNAEKDFEKVLSFDYKNIPYLFHLASNQEKEGSEEKLNKSLTNYFTIIEIDPIFAPAYNGIAIIYEKQKNFEKSLYFFNKAIQLDNSNPLFWNNRACTLKNLGK